MKHWRCEDERERLKEAAREMREAGAAMQDVADALEVPAPTLYRWAAEGRWRAMDIAQVRMRAAEEAAKARAAAAAASPAAPPAEPEAAGTGAAQDEAASEPEPWVPVGALEVRLAGERALILAVELMQAGQLKQAGEAMRLCERVLNSARLLEALPLPPDHDPAVQREWEENDKELSRLIRNLVKAALRGEVNCLPKWATSKSFLADTLYPDRYNWDDTQAEA